MNKKETIKAAVKDAVILAVIFWLVAASLLVLIAWCTAGIVTIVLDSFVGGVSIYVAIPILLRIDKIKFVKFDGKALFASFQFFLIGGIATAICATLPWLGIATSGIGLVAITIISMLVVCLCAMFMTAAILSMYDL